MKTMKTVEKIVKLVALTVIAIVAMMTTSCSGRQLEVVNECELKTGKVVTGTLYDASVIFMYDGENIGQFYLGDIPVGKSVKISVPSKADKVALSWCFIPKEQTSDKKIDAELYELAKKFSTRMLPNFTYLEEKGTTQIAVGETTYSVMVK